MTQTHIHGKVLIENWVEERACEGYDVERSAPEVNWSGHTGIITTKSIGEELSTTVRETYRPPSGNKIRQKGVRRSMLEEGIYRQVTQDVTLERQPKPIVTDYQSTTHKDYETEFVSDWPEPETHHNLLKELPVSYWTDNVKKGIDGVTQVRAVGSPFKKNTAFSTPTEVYMDQRKPYEEDELVQEPLSRHS